MPKCARCHDPELLAPDNGGGPLSSWACPRCGGGFIPEDGASRLFEELSHSTGDVRELAALFGGMRLPCPGCRSRMSPLQLRGVGLDVCFGCGSLWVDAGDLETVSSGRYHMPLPTQPAKATAAIIPTQALVRIDERSLPRHVSRAVLASVGAVGVLWCLVGLLPLSNGATALLALALAGGLSRRQAFDVLPRAHRMMRWRGFFAPGPCDTHSDPFSPHSCVVVRRQRVRSHELPWVVIDLVDVEGRDLARLHGPMLPQRAWTEAPRYGRALGVTVRFDVEPRADDALDVAERSRADLPGFAAHAAFRLSDERAAPGMRRLVLTAVDGTAIGAVTTEVPALPRAARTGAGDPWAATAPERLEGVLAEHFVLEDAATQQRARLYSTLLFGKRATIVVGPAGAALGSVETRRGFLADVVTWTGPQGRRQLSSRVAHGVLAGRILDGFGRDVGALDMSTGLPGDPRAVSVTIDEGRATGDARWGLLALVVHVSLASAVDEL